MSRNRAGTRPRGGFFFGGLMAACLVACAPLPEQRAGIPTRWEPSPNHNHRRPNFVIIHHSGDDSAMETLRTLADPIRAVSAHYLIGRDGTIYQLVDERARAWHAGDSRWGSSTDINSSSLGIELDNNGAEPFPEAQIRALLELLADIKKRYRIPAANFLGHADVAPARKADPSRHFPWKKLAESGFGLWCDPPYPERQSPLDATIALRALGYDVSDVAAALRAFKSHFAQDDSEPVLTGRDRDLLHCLLQRGSRLATDPGRD